MPTKMGSNMDSIGPTGTAPAARTGPVMTVLLQRRAGEPQGGQGRGVPSRRVDGQPGRPGKGAAWRAGDGPGDGLDQIQSVMSPPSLAAGACGDAGAGILWSGRLSGVGRVLMTSLAGTWGR